MSMAFSIREKALASGVANETMSWTIPSYMYLRRRYEQHEHSKSETCSGHSARSGYRLAWFAATAVL